MELVKGGRAFVAGVVGGTIMSVGMAIARDVFAIPIQLEMMLGTATGLGTGRGTFAIGLVMHLIASGLIAELYAFAFERIAHRSGALPGVVLAIPHMVIGGLVVGAMPAIHPSLPDTLVAPGPFLSFLGDGAVLFFVLTHAVYGAFVGIAYGPVADPVRTKLELPTFGRRTV